RRHQHQEVAILPGFSIGQQRQSEILVGERVVELKVFLGLLARSLEAQLGAALTVPRHGYLVRRREYALEVYRRAKLQAGGDALDGLNEHMPARPERITV